MTTSPSNDRRPPAGDESLEQLLEAALASDTHAVEPSPDHLASLRDRLLARCASAGAEPADAEQAVAESDDRAAAGPSPLNVSEAMPTPAVANRQHAAVAARPAATRWLGRVLAPVATAAALVVAGLALWLAAEPGDVLADVRRAVAEKPVHHVVMYEPIAASGAESSDDVAGPLTIDADVNTLRRVGQSWTFSIDRQLTAFEEPRAEARAQFPQLGISKQGTPYVIVGGMEVDHEAGRMGLLHLDPDPAKCRVEWIALGESKFRTMASEDPTIVQSFLEFAENEGAEVKRTTVTFRGETFDQVAVENLVFAVEDLVSSSEDADERQSEVSSVVVDDPMPPVSMSYQVLIDRETDLPVRLLAGTTFVDASNTPVTTQTLATIDYPDRAPQSLAELELPVPYDSLAVIEKPKETPVDLILRRQKIVREFPSYVGYRLQFADGSRLKLEQADRLWRDGLRWRIELDGDEAKRLQGLAQQPFDGSRFAWIHERLGDITSRPVLISDGRRQESREGAGAPERSRVDGTNPLPLVEGLPEFLAYGPIVSGDVEARAEFLPTPVTGIDAKQRTWMIELTSGESPGTIQLDTFGDDAMTVTLSRMLPFDAEDETATPTIVKSESFITKAFGTMGDRQSTQFPAVVQFLDSPLVDFAVMPVETIDAVAFDVGGQESIALPRVSPSDGSSTTDDGGDAE